MKRILIIPILLACYSILFVSCADSPVPEAADFEVMVEPMEEVQGDPDQPSAAVAMDQAVIYNTGADADSNSSLRSSRLIIKNAEIKLLVDNSDIAVDRTTQIIADVGGYIISSRVWYEEWGDTLLKYSTITIGVPSDQFERTLQRLRDVAIRVLDENATGDDVTDEYVNLHAQIKNLEATRDRIKGFLEVAENVEEALTVNEELSKIEGQIEEIQGRINYLADRSAYSTITISIEPELKDLPTLTPQPTRTPIPWNASETYSRAKNSLVVTYRGFFDLLIWIGIVIIPVVGPFVLIGWGLFRFSKSRKKEEVDEK